jgi:aminoglycoside phosphotransferase (APT) family kinase protein
VLKALFGVPVTISRIRALCQGDAIIGSAFYVMDFVPGRRGVTGIGDQARRGEIELFGRKRRRAD